MNISLPNLKEKFDELWDCTLTLQVLRLTDWLGSSYLANRYLRPTILRWFGFKLGHFCYIRPNINMQSKRKNLSIGNHSAVNMFCYIDAPSPVKIGNYCNIGPNVSFLNGTHEVTSNFQDVRPTVETQTIVVEDFVWIAANVTILHSVRIGRGSVIAAGAVVTRDVPPYCLVGGIPAKVLRYLDSSLDPQSTQASRIQDIQSHLANESILLKSRPK